jgi:phage terminase large subunit-like protein
VSQVITQNPARAEAVIAFLEKLPITEGPALGKYMLLDDWQKAFVRDIYSPMFADGRRVVRTAVLTVARKNAKSYLTAGLLLCHLVGPEAVTNGQVYSCAVDREQAAVIFDMCAKMISMRPGLQKFLKVKDSTKTIAVAVSNIPGRGSKYRALSSEASSKHGYGPSFFVFDEYGETPLKDQLFSVMQDGMQAREEPLIVVISTQNDDPQHPFSQMIDDAVRGDDPTKIAHVHAADEGCALMDRAQWFKANPALRTWKSVTPIELAAAEAVRMPSKEQNFRRRYLNQRVSMHSALITRVDWQACGPANQNLPTFSLADTWDFEPGEPVFCGLDMSKRTDLTALVVTSANNGSRVKSYFFKPAAHIKEHGERDKRSYDLYVKQGWMIAPPGRSIDGKDVAAVIERIHKRNPIVGLGYDPAMAEELVMTLNDMNVEAQVKGGDGIPIFPWHQGPSMMGAAINAFEHEILQNTLQHDGNPLLTWNVMNAVVKPDDEGRRKFLKNMTRFRIDGAIAIAIALGLKARERPKQAPANPWEDENFSLFAA